MTIRLNESEKNIIKRIQKETNSTTRNATIRLMIANYPNFNEREKELTKQVDNLKKEISKVTKKLEKERDTAIAENNRTRSIVSDFLSLDSREKLANVIGKNKSKKTGTYPIKEEVIHG